ncbi:c-type cytochrome [Croceicoccus ponticola]|uniref:C-type cytochrome n=2 Tax=Croceicoccus ponticola TaxID=2217664 RepID=A0A437GVU6_9SPHN|nr:c-type cytochrome [Croceicoccus ponticola]
MRKAPITIVTTLALALAACSGGSEDTAETPATAETAEAAEVVATDATIEATATDPAVEASPEATASAKPTPEPTKEVAKAPEAKPEPTPAKVEVASAEPPASYARCAVCHTANKGGENKLGPNLYGTYGKAAGVHSSFNYSTALKDSGVTWTDQNLHAWLENPRTLIPGNRMSFPGLKDAAKRQEIIDYLKKQR